MLLSSALVLGALALVYQAKSQSFPEARQQISAGRWLDLNTVSSSTALLPFLREISGASDKTFLARKLYAAVHRHDLPNVGALANIRVTASGVRGTQGLEALSARLAAAQKKQAAAEQQRDAKLTWFGRELRGLRDAVIHREPLEASVPLITPRELHNLKAFWVVRTPAEFRNRLLLWGALFFFGFYAVHMYWRSVRFAGDNMLLPVMHLLSGLGLVLMISLQDPLRDTLRFSDFSLAVFLGCAVLALVSSFNFERNLKRYSFIFLAGALLLGILLASPLGSGPGTSDAKVNLFHFQPVELIRIFLVLFLAGYFAENWDFLRDLRQRGGVLPGLSARFHIPRLDYVLPVAAGTAAALLLFFFLKDLGPALVIGCLFLILYAIARRRIFAALSGFAVIVAAFTTGHAIGYPETVRQRVDMWWSPWSNTVPGGDQVAHSLWALASGGLFGSGAGLGSPALLPAGHTDLILSAAGEEFGFAGLLCIFLLYSVLIYRSLRIALRAPGAYSFFLVTGLALIVALQILLIAGGLLDLVPLSGVVSPFLSFGKSSMLANFALFGMILAVSAQESRSDHARNFGVPVRWLLYALGAACAALLLKAGYVQTAAADRIAVREAEVRDADGGLALRDNPRITAIVARLPKGSIFDRNGLPLATSNWKLVEQQRPNYEQLGVSIETNASPSERRYYPLGPEFFYLVGDTRTTLRQGATNVAFQERLSRVRLQGFDDLREPVTLADHETGDTFRVWKHDYSELLPFLRHHSDPANPEVKAVLDRQRDVHMSIDARLQLEASRIIKRHLGTGGKGAAVILDPANGDLLAAVSYPWPDPAQFASFRANPDRDAEREFQDRARYGLYPPGSSFKLVTAMAALRLNPELRHEKFECKALPDGRVGNYIGRSRRPIRDDVQDRVPHGIVDMARGITVSCNAYFAQLGSYRIGPQPLLNTALPFGIEVAKPNTPGQLRASLPQASYGQGQVVVTPFQMAKVAATIANAGQMQQGRWITDESNPRINAPVAMLAPDRASHLAGFMRAVVTSGTGRVLKDHAVAIAGKTGTAELANAPSHAWFIGFAPYGPDAPKRIAFAVLVENGRYGGRTAAPIAGELVTAARQLGLL